MATVVEPQIREAEIQRSRQERPGSLAAYDLYLQAMARVGSPTEEDNAAAFAFINKAIALEPNNGIMLSQAVAVMEMRSVMAWPQLTADDKALARDLITRALANAHNEASVLSNCGITLIQVNREYELGLATLRRAVAANPNDIRVMISAGIGNQHCGDLNESLAYLNRALTLGPADPRAFVTLTGIAHVYMILGKYEDALAFAERSLGVHAAYEPCYWMLIAANAQLGRMAAARDWVAKLRALTPGITVSRISAGQADPDGTRMRAILDGLRMAGLPEG